MGICDIYKQYPNQWCFLYFRKRQVSSFIRMWNQTNLMVLILLVVLKSHAVKSQERKKACFSFDFQISSIFKAVNKYATEATL